ncbi:hypothetical protein TNCV_552111 [Trichonephila clavipes]|nr:hypothetical protein TNCV_552111 [Trichonephila clavipes]
MKILIVDLRPKKRRFRGNQIMKEVAEESMKMAAVEEYSSSPDNLLTVSGDGTWKTRGHSSLIEYVL